MEKSHVSALVCHNMGTQRWREKTILSLVPLLLAAVFLTSLLVGSTGSAATLRSFQSPISPVSPLISPSEPVARPTATPTPQPAAPAVPLSAASSPILWIVIGLVVVGAFAVGLVFFQKRRD